MGRQRRLSTIGQTDFRYRQQDWLAGSGWGQTRSTLLNILMAAEFVLRPLVDFYYRRLLMTTDVIGCDETRVTLITPTAVPNIADDASVRDRRRHEVLSEAIAKERPSLNARMWAYRGVHVPINVFDFTSVANVTGPMMCWRTFAAF